MDTSRFAGIDPSAQCSFKDVKLVITDIDNTVWDLWGLFGYYAPKAVCKIAAKLKVPEADVYAEIGKAMLRYGLEYPWLLEMTRFAKEWKGSRSSFREQISSVWWFTLQEARISFCRPFIGVHEVFESFSNKNIPIVALSDAPMPIARSRVAQMLLDSRLSGLYAVELKEPKPEDLADSDDLAFGREKVWEMLNTPIQTGVIQTVTELKPSPQGVDMILREFGVQPEECLFIGDNLSHDGGAAKSRNIRYVWARYGTWLPAPTLQLLDVLLSPGDKHHGKPPSGTAEAKMLPPMVAQAAGFEEIENHLSSKCQLMPPRVGHFNAVCKHSLRCCT